MYRVPTTARTSFFIRGERKVARQNERETALAISGRREAERDNTLFSGGNRLTGVSNTTLRCTDPGCLKNAEAQNQVFSTWGREGAKADKTHLHVPARNNPQKHHGQRGSRGGKKHQPGVIRKQGGGGKEGELNSRHRPTGKKRVKNQKQPRENGK